MYQDDPKPSTVTIRRLQNELSIIDEALQAMAVMTKGSVTIYEHGSPIRAVEFRDHDGLSKRILFEPFPSGTMEEANEPKFVFHVELEAWLDDAEGRGSWHRHKATVDSFSEAYVENLKLLEECSTELRSISRRDLLFEPFP